MCGIVGFTDKFDLSVLKRMNRSLTHRGPDDEGYYQAQGISLAMRRLSIIDVSSGHQPVCNEDETVWTVFNGEIYNFLELRKELTAKGHKFQTDHSDTETIVHAYEEYGPEFVKRLNGMFAIAVWDVRRRKLLLYRDRIGEKPLYFWQHGHHLSFASEIKALLTLPNFKKKLNEKALFYYLSLKNSVREHSFFQGIESVNPGECLIFSERKLKRKTYWEIDASKPLGISEKDAAGEIRRILKDSVKYRMISDVPLGAYLSGGVDSSAVVGLMSKISKKPLKTFSLTYKDDLPNKEQDEIWAGRMAKRFGTHHRIYRMKASEFQNDLEQVIESFDEPFGGTISTYFLSKLIRKHVKVAVSGDGADELFGSYKAHRLAFPMANLNHFIERGKDPYRLSEKEKRTLWPFESDISYLLALRGAKPHEWHSRLSVFDDSEKVHLFSPTAQKKLRNESLSGYYRRAYERSKTEDPLNQVLQVECQNLLPDQVLAFVDRLSMAHSVEVRPPFLDHRLIEFAFRLPGHMKIRYGSTKYILKKAVAGILPSALIRRPKEGFILPYHFWMQKYMYAKIHATLSKREVERHGLFNSVYVERLLKQFESGDLRDANKVWLLFVFQIWWKKYFGK